MPNRSFDLAELKRLLHYDPRTGHFTWLVTRGGFARAGSRAGAKDANGYVNIRVKRRLIKAHRLAWFYVRGVWPARDLDHANRDRSDNRIANLRVATDAQNVANSTVRRDNRCGLKGVSQRGAVFIARITKDKCRVEIGRFRSKEAAHAAYCAEAKQFFGQFARAS